MALFVIEREIIAVGSDSGSTTAMSWCARIDMISTDPARMARAELAVAFDVTDNVQQIEAKRSAAYLAACTATFGAAPNKALLQSFALV